jgi:hypothetical protein
MDFWLWAVDRTLTDDEMARIREQISLDVGHGLPGNQWTSIASRVNLPLSSVKRVGAEIEKENAEIDANATGGTKSGVAPNPKEVLATSVTASAVAGGGAGVQGQAVQPASGVAAEP